MNYFLSNCSIIKVLIVPLNVFKIYLQVLVSRDMVMDETRGELIYSTNVLLGKDEVI